MAESPLRPSRPETVRRFQQTLETVSYTHLETYYGAKQGKYPVFRLSERFLGAGLPDVLISDMRGLVREGRTGVIGPQLESELIDTLDKGRQAILFLNRRGNSRVIGCALCGCCLLYTSRCCCMRQRRYWARSSRRGKAWSRPMRC